MIEKIERKRIWIWLLPRLAWAAASLLPTGITEACHCFRFTNSGRGADGWRNHDGPTVANILTR